LGAFDVEGYFSPGSPPNMLIRSLLNAARIGAVWPEQLGPRHAQAYLLDHRVTPLLPIAPAEMGSSTVKLP
jgi:hypothetical protein